MKRFAETISRPARIAFWLALIFAVVMAVLPRPPELPTDNLGDKFQHMMAFFTLTALAGVGWPRLSLLRLALSLSVVGAGIEIAQSIPVLHRTADWHDWLADLAAILAALVPLALLRHLYRSAG